MEQKILEYADIDTRRSLGLPPRKLKTSFVLPPKYSYFYFHKSQKLMRICPDCHTEIMSPVSLDLAIDKLYAFNASHDYYTYEYYDSYGRVMVDPTYCMPIIASSPIKFIGLE